MEQETMKILNKTFTLVAVLVVGVLVFLVGQMMYQSRTLDQMNQNQVTVTGNGKVYAKPDIATVSFGVSSQAKTVADVTKTNTDQMNAVISAIKDLKIDEKDIQTTNYVLTPVYEGYKTVPTPIAVPMMYPVNAGGSGSGTIIRTGTTLTGYKLEQNIEVKIRDFTKIGDVLAAATGKGANMVNDFQFAIENPEKYKDQARAQAISQAKTNAESLARESGVSLGKIINVYENSYSGGMYASKMMDSVAPQAVSLPIIQPGQQEIDVTINLTYKVN